MTEKVKDTPMIRQYFDIKKNYKDALLFFRVGDFYELFFDDASQASKVLGLALTRRHDMLMCGMPAHAYDTYVARLIKQGFKVAICDQIETTDDAKLRKSNVVMRDVVRFITPGTITEDNLLDARENNYLLAVHKSGDSFGVAWLDISTGVYITRLVRSDEVSSVINNINPSEILVSDSYYESDWFLAIKEKSKNCITLIPHVKFDFKTCYKRLCNYYGVDSMDSYGNFTNVQYSVSGVLLDYINLTQKGKFPAILPLKNYIANDFMSIDSFSRRNLEVILNMRGSKDNTLLDSLGSMTTATGSREIAVRLQNPLLDIDVINARQDSLSYFVENGDLREQVIGHLESFPDVERSLSRIMLERGGPRDLIAISKGIKVLGDLKTILVNVNISKEISNLYKMIDLCNDLAWDIDNAILEEPPILIREGGFIKRGYDANLDHLRDMKENNVFELDKLQSRYVSLTGISSLKIRYNNILGHFVEVPAKVGEKLFSEGIFTHRQTMVNTVRFSTKELMQLDKDLIDSQSKTIAIEIDIFRAICQKVADNVLSLTYNTRFIAAIDIACSLANVALNNGWIKPEINKSNDIIIEDGRHPVVEKMINSDSRGRFVPNTLAVESGKKVWILTGPNMAGKSTFLRQNALIIILAQIGSYVPARFVSIGVVDKIFSRVGASDDLARGHSTFMVEMLEVGAILNQSTKNSFVILDEVGRGTATFDGMAIAWATVEYIHDKIGCNCIFATHYHELTKLESLLKDVSCYQVKVEDYENKIVFTYQVSRGSIDKSYGIHVAKIAGVPSAVLNRATDILHKLEKEKNIDLPLFRAKSKNYVSEDNKYFENEVVDKEKNKKDILWNSIKSMKIDDLTPRELYNKISDLKNNLDS